MSAKFHGVVEYSSDHHHVAVNPVNQEVPGTVDNPSRRSVPAAPQVPGIHASAKLRSWRAGYAVTLRDDVTERGNNQGLVAQPGVRTELLV